MEEGGEILQVVDGDGTFNEPDLARFAKQQVEEAAIAMLTPATLLDDLLTFRGSSTSSRAIRSSPSWGLR